MHRNKYSIQTNEHSTTVCQWRTRGVRRHDEIYRTFYKLCLISRRLELPKIHPRTKYIYTHTIMRGPRTIALRRGLVTPRSRLLIAAPSVSRTISTATASRSTILPAAVVSGKTRWHSTQAGPSSPIPEISQENTYDIVIIGAANAGLALACSLRKLRILGIEGLS